MAERCAALQRGHRGCAAKLHRKAHKLRNERLPARLEMPMFGNACVTKQEQPLSSSKRQPEVQLSAELESVALTLRRTYEFRHVNVQCGM